MKPLNRFNSFILLCKFNYYFFKISNASIALVQEEHNCPIAPPTVRLFDSLCLLSYFKCEKMCKITITDAIYQFVGYPSCVNLLRNAC